MMLTLSAQYLYGIICGIFYVSYVTENIFLLVDESKSALFLDFFSTLSYLHRIEIIKKSFNIGSAYIHAPRRVQQGRK